MDIQLLNGTTVDTDAINFDKSTYQFYLGSENLTDLIRRIDKRRFSGFDDTTENLRVYKLAHPDAMDTGPTTIWGNFWNQISTDPLEAPVELLERKVGGALDSTTGKIAIVLVVIGAIAVGYAVLKKAS